MRDKIAPLNGPDLRVIMTKMLVKQSMWGTQHYSVRDFSPGSPQFGAQVILGVNRKGVMVMRTRNEALLRVKYRELARFCVASGGHRIQLWKAASPDGAPALELETPYAEEVFAHVRDYCEVHTAESLAKVKEQLERVDVLETDVEGPASTASASTPRRRKTGLFGLGGSVSPSLAPVLVPKPLQESLLGERMKAAGASDEDIESVLRSDCPML